MTDVWADLSDIDEWMDVCDECGNGPLTGEDLERGACECCMFGHQSGKYNTEQCWRCLASMVEDKDDGTWEED